MNPPNSAHMPPENTNDPLTTESEDKTATKSQDDPRIGALLNFTQALMVKYSELASSVCEHLPDEKKRDELVKHVQGVMASAHERYAQIAAMPPENARSEDPYQELVEHLTAARKLLAQPAKQARRLAGSKSPTARNGADDAYKHVERLRSQLRRMAADVGELEQELATTQDWHNRHEQVQRMPLPNLQEQQDAH